MNYGTGRIIVLSDLHAGSHLAPYPTSWLPAHPEYLASRYLTDCLSSAIDTISPTNDDILVLNGDLIDGSQKKSGGLGLFTPRLRDQVAAAIELLTPIASRVGSIIRIEGTPYHDDDHDPLFAFDEHFGVKLVTQVLNLSIPVDHLGNTAILNIAHHPSFKFEHRGGGMSKTAFYNLVNSARRKAPLARWIIESHLHFYSQFEDMDVNVVACPCFQMPTAWATKVNRMRFTADLGCLVMRPDSTHMSGWRISPVDRFDTPMPTITDVVDL